ncbi:MAG: hypothetical protein QE487_02975 [Fluviicola sp.]|nr:hypothetical protein [Fluviicola sp.]
MKNLVFWSLFCLLTISLWSQGNPMQISYPDCKLLNQVTGTDTLFGIHVQCSKTRVQGTQKIQTFCNGGDPSAARYEKVQVVAEVSVIPDSTGIIKDSLLSALRFAIQKEEAYAASNGFAATVVSKFALFKLGEQTILAMPPFNSGKGNFGIWYINGVVYKIKLIEDNQLGSIKVFLRSNFKLSYNNSVLNTDSGEIAIEPLRVFLEQSR